MTRLRLLLLAVALPFAPATTQVPYARLVDASADSANWLTYSGNYYGHRFSRLTQVTPANVKRLRPVWVYQGENAGDLELTPLVVGGVMYVSEANNGVVALDARTGRELWRWGRPLPKNVRAIGHPPSNRGVAILDTTVYVGTVDAHLIALDARSGVLRWDAVVGDNKASYAITSAPLAVNGKIVIGVSGAEAGIRGFVDAYDARAGTRLWRFYTIPAPGEPGSETWSGEAWKTGGGSTWLTGSYDPDLGILYWGVGNPGPDWNGDSRPGDNLYTCSLVALDAATGTLRWHFQFTPHDTHDWDANQIPVLLDWSVNGTRRKLVAMANRNGFYYVLDRTTGEFLDGVPYGRQSWAKGLDAAGRPVLNGSSDPTSDGLLVYPSVQGTTNWFSPSYSPRTQLFYVAVREMGSRYFKGEAQYAAGEPFMGGGEQELGGDSAWGAIRALDARTGARRWEFRLHSPPWAGVLSTAGGLVFSGSNEGNFYALDARTGKALWDFQTGGAIRSGPISFSVDGAQRVAVAVWRNIYVFGLAP